MHIFSLVSSGQYACVCVMTISCKLYQKVLNVILCVGDLLVMANVVDLTTLAYTSPELLRYLTHSLEDSVSLVGLKVIPITHR